MLLISVIKTTKCLTSEEIVPNKTHENIIEGCTVHVLKVGNNLLKYVSADDILCKLKSSYKNNLLVQAHNDHSDLVTGIYEGQSFVPHFYHLIYCSILRWFQNLGMHLWFGRIHLWYTVSR